MHLESQRGNKPATRNYRLAAIRSFFKHLVRNDPSHGDQYHRVLTVQSKRTHPPSAQYLEPEDMRVILKQPDGRTALGLRDDALLSFMYNTGARVSEVLAVRLEDLSLRYPKQVVLHGKGKKQRVCPLWRETVAALRRLPTVREGKRGDLIFRNRRGEPLTRNGVAYLLDKYKSLAARKVPSLQRRRIAPHLVRHSAAVANVTRRCIYHRHSRRSRPRQHRDHQSLHHDQPPNETRGARRVLAPRGNLAKAPHALETYTRFARIPRLVVTPNALLSPVRNALEA